ncbi:RING finger protein B [Spatholobus suberectus]|nr:RING finger protein B [Spatholobus suberectus]
MLVRRRVMSWRRVGKALQALLAHAFLFSFAILLALRLDLLIHYSWWKVFVPLWLFHAVVSRGRFSLPAPSMPHDRQWAPCHSVVATPLLVAFELLLCIYLWSSYVINLRIVFVPLLAFEVVILIDNIRMCRALMPGDDENLTDEAVWETLPHFWISISMVFFIAATVFTLLKICGDVAALGWWDLFINFGIAQCFAFLVCTKWHNPSIHGGCHITEPCSSSNTIRYLDLSRGGLVIYTDEDRQQNGFCNLQHIGGHIMKIPFIGFQILLFMHLEGTPPSAKNMPHWVIFSPLFLLQGVGVLFAAYRLMEKIVLLLYSGDIPVRYSDIASKSRECFGFFRRGSRLLGWWSIDEGSREEEARLFCAGSSGYNTFTPDTVKKMPRTDLVEEIWRLQAALGEQTEVTKFSQEEYERLQNEKILCRICFEEQINMVLLPCRHHILCNTCCEKCKKCPVCRGTIEERMPVYDV